MNTQSNDVVKTAELNNSNEQQKIVKPIIVSRRRLLRAGAAGIPVMLTMAGVAPAIEGANAWSAASGLKYGDGGKVRARFNESQFLSDDNLVHSDNNGFVYNSKGGLWYGDIKYKTDTLTGSVSVPDSLETSIKLVPNDTTSNYGSISVSINPLDETTDSNTFEVPGYQHKFGNFYSPLIPSSGTSIQDTLRVGCGGSGDYIIISVSLPSGYILDSNNLSYSSTANEPIITTYTSAKGVSMVDHSTEQMYYKMNDLGKTYTVKIKLEVSGSVTAHTDSEPTSNIIFTPENKPFNLEFTYTFYQSRKVD